MSRKKGTDSFKIIIKIEVVHAGIAKYVNTKFDTSNYKVKRPLSRGKNKSNWINEKGIGRKMLTRFVW